MRIGFICFIFLFFGCRGDIRNFDDGEFITNRPENIEYKKKLELLLTQRDSIERGDYPILPPNLSEDPVSVDTVDNVRRVTVKINNGQDAVFNDIISHHEYKAFDNLRRIVYLRIVTKERWVLKGICIDEGNQFEVCRGGISSNEYVYDWAFSPDWRYLLRVGDIDDEVHGWSIVDLENGAEGKVANIKYSEFVVLPRWISPEEFSFTVAEMPFKEGVKYTKDYSLYRSILRGSPDLSFFRYDIMYLKTYVMHVKGYLISEKYSKIQM